MPVSGRHLLIVALLAAAFAPAATGSTAGPLAYAITVPVACYTTQADLTNAYLAAGGTDTFANNINGFWGDVNVGGMSEEVISLSQATCQLLNHAAKNNGPATAQAIFVLAHEETHATGADYTYMAAHANDPVFVSTANAIVAQYGLPYVNAEREAAADCVGLHNTSGIAYKLGMRGNQAFGNLAQYAQGDGYVWVPKECAA